MNTQGPKLGTLPDKELELLRDAHQQLSVKTSRFALLQVSLLAFIVFAFTNAFKQVDDKGAPEKLRDIRILGKITNQSARDLGADPIMHFFILRDLLDEPDYNKLKKFRKVEQYEIEEAQRVLGKYVPTGAMHQPSFQEADQSPISEDQKQAIRSLQIKLAQEIRKVYGDAFSPEFNLGGAKIVFDLRNWAVFLFPLFLLSEVYLLTLRKKQHLIRMVAAHRVQSLRTPSPGAVTTMDLITFYENPFNTTAFTRYPGQLTDWLYLIAVAGLLIFLAIATKSFWGDFDFPIICPIILILLLGTSHAIAYYIHVSNRLEQEIQNQTNLSLPGCLDTIRSCCTRWVRRAAGYRIPRFWLSTGGGLILLSLFMAVGVNSCGGPCTGYDLVKGKGMFSISKDARPTLMSTMWFPVWWEMFRKNLLLTETDKDTKVYDWSKPATTGVERFIRSHRLIGWGAYTAALSLAGVTLLLVLVSFHYGWALGNRPVGWLLRVSGALLLFLITDLYFFFVLPHVRVAILSMYWLFPLVFWFWSGFSKNGQAHQGRQISRTILQLVAAPLVTLTLILSTALALFTLFGYHSAGDSENLGEIWPLCPGLFCLLIGCGLVCFGYIQLNSPAIPQQTPSA